MRAKRSRLGVLQESFVECVRREFPAATQSANAAGLPQFTIPPRAPEFGPLVAEVEGESSVELTLSIGRFTHTHFTGASAVEDLIAMCRRVLADEIVVAPDANGCSMIPREYADLTPDGEFWVWSGRLASAE